MKSYWRKHLKYDPITPLTRSDNQPLRYFVDRHLLDREEEVERLWQLPNVERILGDQQENGAWKYHDGKEHILSREDYDQLETYRILGQLVEKYGLNNRNSAIQRASEYLFSRQSEEGDFRGIYGNQYTPNYSAGIMELLIKAGFANDSRIKKGFRWLLSIRQKHGGWAIPLRTKKRKFDSGTLLGETIHGEPAMPCSHLVTGIVLRAFAAHPEYQKSEEARVAGRLLVSRFFEVDRYPDQCAPTFWTSFSFPFWFTDLLSSLDSLSLVAFTRQNAQIKRALDWFVERQQENGFWKLTLRTMTREKDRDLWISFVVCRVLRRFLS